MIMITGKDIHKRDIKSSSLKAAGNKCNTLPLAPKQQQCALSDEIKQHILKSSDSEERFLLPRSRDQTHLGIQ